MLRFKPGDLVWIKHLHCTATIAQDDGDTYVGVHSIDSPAFRPDRLLSISKDNLLPIPSTATKDQIEALRSILK